VLFTSITVVFQEYYDFNTSNVGICFLGLGMGSFLGVGIFSAVSDRILKAKAAQQSSLASDAERGTSTNESSLVETETLQPEYRLPPLPFAVLSLIFGLLVYGWTAQLRLHWTIPVIGTVFIGLGQLLLYMVLQMYLIDSFTIYAASAVAALTAVRSVAGAFLPLIGLSLYERFGVGWGNTILAAVCLPLLGVSWALLRWGKLLREGWVIKSL
jgi:MFS family permease